ncbi:probable lipid phosphate phosphatase beta isoform X2 [Cynara cardunculus var. scolymus]|uniref:probable lipid phosphate phosphatase beta isoform X2 n=1 Tax=Cynara cardunculus var. scolymus TaxID=59895 RepID=UPI000D624E28|nr:probable lipid phosphate phosphatase beta isoform X2 [Cynara cardunculus var. scolymus]
MEEPAPPPPPPSSSTSIFRQVINSDTTVSLTIHNLTQPILPRSFLKLLEISGDGRLFFPILLSLLLSPLPSTSPLLLSLLINFLIGSLLDLLLVGLIKHLVRRPRPVYNKNMFLTFAVDHWSFPSGHASRVCFTASLFYLSSDLIPDIFLQLKSDMLGSDVFESVKRLNMIVIAWATVTSVSRVLLGRHFVFDVAAGAGLGVLNASFVFHFLNFPSCRTIIHTQTRGTSCV